MTSQQQECCILHICNNELQEVLDMPARVFQMSFLICSGFSQFKDIASREENRALKIAVLIIAHWHTQLHMGYLRDCNSGTVPVSTVLKSRECLYLSP